MKRTIYVVSVENQGSGLIAWFYGRDIAEVAFDQGVRNSNSGDYLALFEMKVPSHLRDDEITEMADLEMWDCGRHYMQAIKRVDRRTAEDKLEYGPDFGERMAA